MRDAALAVFVSALVGNASAAPFFDGRNEGLSLGAGIGAQISAVDTGAHAAEEEAGGVSVALSAGYGLDARTSLATAFHYADHDDGARSRGIGLLGLGLRHRLAEGPNAWYVEGLVGHAFVTGEFDRDEADALDDDDVAGGTGVRLAVGRALGKYLRVEGALLGAVVDGGHLDAGEELEASSSQLQLVWRID